MKTRFLPAALLASVLLLAGWAALASLSFDPSSKIWIEGTSNVHGWTCEVARFDGSLEGTVEGGALTGVSATRVTVPVAQLDCNNGQMNRRMRDAMQADAHPSIRFTLTRATVGAPNGDRFAVQAEGQLTIAGETQPVRLTLDGRALGNDRFRLTGTAPVRMSRFGISPPTAMMGAMRTGDDVTVHLDVTVRG